MGKSLVTSTKVTISPLKKGRSYLIKYSTIPHFMEVEGGNIYSFEVGGNYDDVIYALRDLDKKRIFNTTWEIVDVRLKEVKFNCKGRIRVSIRTPALIADPLIKSKKKRFTNAFSFVFAVNFMDHLKITREEYRKLILELEEKVREEPSEIGYASVIYAGKKIIGIVGKLRYELLEVDERIIGTLENALAKGIGSSRRNGFGRIEVKCEDYGI